MARRLGTRRGGEGQEIKLCGAVLAVLMRHRPLTNVVVTEPFSHSGDT